MEKKKMWEKVEEMREEMVEMQKELCARPAISPESGGEGEYEKAEYLKKKLQEIGLLVEEYDAKDDRAKKGIRPNIVAKLKERDSKKSVWILTHMDVVPPGDLRIWKTDPFKAVVKDGKIYGRGTTDNQQDMVASIFAVKALKDLEITPPCDIGLSFVADEETGSRYGLSHLLSAYKGFKEGDMILVPDFPSPDGSLIEVAEKSIMWLKSVVEGKQSHGSMPQKGINANRIACELTYALDESLHQNYSIKDEIFDPPSSTFEPTKREANVPNINTVPGEDISYWDCRVLPEYDINEIFKEIEGATKSIERKNNARISIEKVVFDQAALPTPATAPVVVALKDAVKKVYGVDTKTIGVGGGTVAAFFRRAGFNAAVWGRSDETEHQPNEYCIIENMVNNAKVFLEIMMGHEYT